ncbi:hypothetical protein C7H19_06450 [Aphanothece hegewaldii CCALA 016]|uniref:Uncharacterized protein n=1 Tax=Aphanothece hegewaldii CCALA 016 TaxID=2107694 RepID=A0A2T1M0C6_9CHRO|nr:Sll0314/Alr1548 family TPR repeat-containing protein [Aphanothece hegewaldii]PSF38107.1 hypothetical protein C7H19_06450 [Aphanothece hegewaldii CCALA 016]
MKTKLNQGLTKIACACSVSLTILTGVLPPSLAGDPFRNSNPRDIGDKTEAAFDELFKKGNYKAAEEYVIVATQTEPNEPLAYAMRASLAYTKKDMEGLKNYANKTIEVAQNLSDKDPLRGNLYLAVGHFLEGGYIFQTEGPVSALPRLQKVFQYLETAEKVNPDDPELNLLKGYLELMLSVNLPFSSPQQAIERLETYAAPNFLVDRGIALAYRDLKDYDQALKFIKEALQETPDNPELHYLTGQILRSKGRKEKNVALLKQALDYYNQAFKKEDQLPEVVLKSLRYEHRKVQAEISDLEGGTPKK